MDVKYIVKPFYRIDRGDTHLFYEIINDKNNFFRIKNVLNKKNNLLVTNQFTHDFLLNETNSNYLESHALKIGVAAGFTVLAIYLFSNRLN